MSRVLTASTTSPCHDPADVKNNMTDTMQSVRRNMSRLTEKNRRIPLRRHTPFQVKCFTSLR